MIVSWNWLRDYVPVNATPETVADRLTMSGLNLGDNGIQPFEDDFAIDLEVTSNRPDCLGHLGIARELAALFNQPISIPAVQVSPGAQRTDSATTVTLEADDVCPRYIARILRNVRIGPSPAWLQRRLKAIGQPVINNVVDVTNYVLMECGQPLHAFDLDRLNGRRIIVRRARAGESIVAINQNTYPLDSRMCVIADAERPVAIAGIMGGQETEISNSTRNLLLEVAEFQPLAIRSTARKLKLRTDSSYRFERGIDVRQMEWASRRACELILQVAGGELMDVPILAGAPIPGDREPVTLRFAQIRRILGIDVPRDEAIRILQTLGMTLVEPPTSESARFIPPSWRRELDREADLIEEVARVHGYEKIPQDVPVPLTLSGRTHRDRVLERVRNVFTSSGAYEAITFSFLPEKTYELLTPRGETTRIHLEHDGWQNDVLRQSLIPSLLISRRENERQRIFNAQLFETARVYLDAKPGAEERTVEPMTIGFVSGRSFADVKGIAQALASAVNPSAIVAAQPAALAFCTESRGAELTLNGRPWGWIGELSRAVTDSFDLHDPVTALEVDLTTLEESADLVPAAKPLPMFPAVERDLNFVLDETVSWEQLESAARKAAGSECEAVSFAGQYRGKQIPEGKKSYIVRLWYRAADRTLTAEEVERFQQAVIAACQSQLGAALR